MASKEINRIGKRKTSKEKGRKRRRQTKGKADRLRSSVADGESGLRVVINKTRGWLGVFRRGKLVLSVPVSTGRNPSDKRHEGDLATPEGEFYVCYKNPRSRYVRFLGISYPNLEAAQRGLREGIISRTQYERIRRALQRRECPPWNTPLGGQIGLHGRTSHPTWTHGCISMDDEAILELYRMVPLGTPVQIFRCESR